MEKSQSRRHHCSNSPSLHRSKSGSASPLPQTTSSKYTKSKDIISAKKTKKKPEAVSDGGGGSLVMFLPRSTSKTEAPRRSRSSATSPSAWALSPGRSLPFLSPEVSAAAKSPASFDKKVVKKEGKGGVGGVLKYFRQKKVSPLLEEEYHQYRVMYNRLLQWRYVNARAEASMAAINRVAQEKILKVWVRNSIKRRIRMEKRSEIERMKQEKKLKEIVNSEMGMLNEWRLIEAKNIEALGRLLRKLSAISNSLPLLHNAKGDTMCVYEAISTAVEVMDDITTMIMGMNSKVEKTCFLLTELSVILKQHKQFFEQLEKPLTLLSSLEAEEKSLRAHHIQLLKQVKEN